MVLMRAEVGNERCYVVFFFGRSLSFGFFCAMLSGEL